MKIRSNRDVETEYDGSQMSDETEAFALDLMPKPTHRCKKHGEHGDVLLLGVEKAAKAVCLRCFFEACKRSGMEMEKLEKIGDD